MATVRIDNIAKYPAPLASTVWMRSKGERVRYARWLDPIHSTTEVSNRTTSLEKARQSWYSPGVYCHTRNTTI